MKMKNEAETYNEIETRIRKKKRVKDYEIQLLFEGYRMYGIETPKDILKILNKRLVLMELEKWNWLIYGIKM